MQKRAEAVHSVNPDVLVILYGFDFDRDLSFIKTQFVKLTFSGKLVFEEHWFGFFDGPQKWVTGNPNEVCGRVATYMLKMSGYLVDQGYPLFISEFGIDKTGANVNGNRNSSFIQRISALQAPFRGLSEAKPYNVIFHPLTGLCITRKLFAHRLRLGPCSESYAWSYSPHKTLLRTRTYLCLQAGESVTSAKLGIFCTASNSKWEMISDSNMHISAKLRDEKSFCLDVASDNTIITSSCKCINKDNTCDPLSQWFKLVDSTRSSSSV
ncbi:Cytochrome P450 86A2 [Hibiscus syriacus]|uniref:Cytochrome P450 86A2 n=1 Tax=Hibiscus syriacus TaxID=106335 RepID=A0A6A2ZTL7_HIBSY|nr:Cytochrome P450 86A2 [Hibiscus syriacus]